ncbi:U32 family peptidase [Microaerobacter geothermalis]|uniref:peptidase U32 family protein n=1 Tax=Microaerobacter geothermalis TaxID=674972 RepID=UPI001F19D07A|nr:peptidase U32 family protein [Microaerobacter geothermalis]MCF6093998.1 U32 family peptidase [Microaerobacter geothermalis]
MALKKPELLTTARNIDELIKVIEAGADAVNIGHERYGLRLPGNFSLNDIEQAVPLAHDKGAKVYVSVNNLMHHEILAELPQYISSLDQVGVDAIVFGDPAVLVTAAEVAPHLSLHWNTETTSTNYETVNYWAQKGASRAILARELSLEAVLEIKKRVNIEIQAQIHGMTCIFHSKRELVSNYMRYQGKEAGDIPSKGRNLFLKEAKRSDERYPVFEDSSGTHIMSMDDICMLEHLPAFIDGGIDSLKIEGILKPMDDHVQIVGIYRQAIDRYVEDSEGYQIDDRWMQVIRELQPENRPLSTGFYFKDLIY